METFRPSAWQLWWHWTRAYEVTDDALTMRWGVATRRHNRIPRNKITNVDLRLSHLLPARSGVGVNVGSGEPIVCEGLTKSDARRLAAALDPHMAPAQAAPPSPPPSATPEPEAHGPRPQSSE